MCEYQFGVFFLTFSHVWWLRGKRCYCPPTLPIVRSFPLSIQPYRVWYSHIRTPARGCVTRLPLRFGRSSYTSKNHSSWCWRWFRRLPEGLKTNLALDVSRVGKWSVAKDHYVYIWHVSLHKWKSILGCFLQIFHDIFQGFRLVRSCVFGSRCKQLDVSSHLWPRVESNILNQKWILAKLFWDDGSWSDTILSVWSILTFLWSCRTFMTLKESVVGPNKVLCFDLNLDDASYSSFRNWSSPNSKLSSTWIISMLHGPVTDSFLISIKGSILAYLIPRWFWWW